MDPINEYQDMSNMPDKGYGYMLGEILTDMLRAPVINTGTWQAMDIKGSKLHDTYEMLDVTLQNPVPSNIITLQEQVRPDLPWAEDHFRERVSGEPLNPAPSHEWWPYAKAGNKQHMAGAKFDHTYPERYWPRKAHLVPEYEGPGHRGIRFNYGDLDSVIDLLARQPHTRQAYLPIFFPEDTGARHNGKDIRVPCSLGYHFMIREGKLSCRYYLRSCDLYRHLRNDLYMTARLVQWVCSQVQQRAEVLRQYGVITDPFFPLEPGDLIMYISSLHLFVPDVEKMKEVIDGYPSYTD